MVLEIAQGKASVGFASASETYEKKDKKDRIKKEALKFLSPEFINRLDTLIIFNSLMMIPLQIIDLHINELKDRLNQPLL